MRTASTGPEPTRPCRCDHAPGSGEGPNPDCPLHGDAVAVNWERLATGYDH